MSSVRNKIKRLLTFGPFANTYQIRCPNGEIKTIYKNIDDVIPLYIKGWDGKLKTELENVNISAEYATKIQGLLYYIDENNKNIIINFRLAYLGFKNDPCKYDDYFNRQVEKIIDDHNKSVIFNSKIKLLKNLAEINKNNSEIFNTLYEQLVNQLIGVDIPKAATSEIAENRKRAQDWVEGEHAR